MRMYQTAEPASRLPEGTAVGDLDAGWEVILPPESVVFLTTVK